MASVTVPLCSLRTTMRPSDDASGVAHDASCGLSTGKWSTSSTATQKLFTETIDEAPSNGLSMLTMSSSADVPKLAGAGTL